MVEKLHNITLKLVLHTVNVTMSMSLMSRGVPTSRNIWISVAVLVERSPTSQQHTNIHTVIHTNPELLHNSRCSPYTPTATHRDTHTHKHTDRVWQNLLQYNITRWEAQQKCKKCREWQQKGGERKGKKGRQHETEASTVKNPRLHITLLFFLERVHDAWKDLMKSGETEADEKEPANAFSVTFHFSQAEGEIWFLPSLIRQRAKKTAGWAQQSVTVLGCEGSDGCLCYSNHNCLFLSTDIQTNHYWYRTVEKITARGCIQLFPHSYNYRGNY